MIILILYIYNIWYTNKYIVYKDEIGISYNLLKNQPNHDIAAKLLIDINHNIYKWFENIQHEQNTTMKQKLLIETMLRNYNPEELYETMPNTFMNTTSYTINKGDKMYICLRQSDGTLIDKNTIMYVILHELSHVANSISWGHDDIFWQSFKYILQLAVKYDLYVGINYSLHNVQYCTLIIDYSPLYDDDLEILI